MTKTAYDQSANNPSIEAKAEMNAEEILEVDLGGRRLSATVISSGIQRHVFMMGQSYVLRITDPLDYVAEQAITEGSMRAPMPGKVVALLVEPQVKLAKGTPLLVLEAMKMEHTLITPYEGRVTAFHFCVGDTVTEDDILLAFEAS